MVQHAAGVSLMGAIYEREQVWAPAAAALSMFALLWARFTWEERSRGIALAGCLWGAIYPMTLAWSNTDRCSLSLFIAGAATAVQGAIQLVLSTATRQ